MLTPFQHRKLFEARVAFLTKQDLPLLSLSSYPTVNDLAQDPNALDTLVGSGLTREVAQIVQRWAINFDAAWKERWAEFTPQEIYALGATNDQEMVSIGIVFHDLYTLAHSESQDLLQVCPEMLNSTAEHILEAAQREYERRTGKHLHQLHVFRITSEGLQEVTSMPPYDPATVDPSERFEQVRTVLEQLGFGKQEETTQET